MSDVSWFADKKNKTRRVLQHTLHKLQGKRPVVVSLTSYPPRIGTVWQTIRSIFGQSYLPDKIVLYLAKSDFPNRETDLPESLTSMLWHDFEIRWVADDLKPHKKYFWAFQEFKDALVITIDDDLLYRREMIEDLVKGHEQFPQAVIASRIHLIAFNDDGSIKPYEQWPQEMSLHNPRFVCVPSMRLLATTGAGTLFDPALFPPLTFNADVIRRNVLTADDIWLKVVEATAGIPVVATTAGTPLEVTPDTQEVALFVSNSGQGINDRSLQALQDDPAVQEELKAPLPQLLRDDSLDALLD